MVAVVLVPEDFELVKLVGEDENDPLVTDWLRVSEELGRDLTDDTPELKDDWRLTEAVALERPGVVEELVDPGLTTGGEAEMKVVEDSEEVDDDFALPDDGLAEFEIVELLDLDLLEDEPDDEAGESVVEVDDEPLVPDLVAVVPEAEDIAVLLWVPLGDVVPLELVPLTLLVGDDPELVREDRDDEAPPLVLLWLCDTEDGPEDGPEDVLEEPSLLEELIEEDPWLSFVVEIVEDEADSPRLELTLALVVSDDEAETEVDDCEPVDSDDDDVWLLEPLEALLEKPEPLPRMMAPLLTAACSYDR
ncbi:hypothetical protein KVT40_001764 [Elsinoe batatas]|uniref:Uncharacterized protein n=1 Tax=Elsinoe batatas TaxID=2601811 RepID=A0A8K0L9T6_9PEZI|nr:hypothetical protein KVT40_001764 [Elsinoe batatas]